MFYVLCFELFLVDDPTHGKWWTTADSPWQALGGIIELAKALNSDDPEGYLSNMPVHQDGSCNGLQHYAALGRDAHGGSQVNLTKTEKPADVYSAIKDKVQEVVNDYANGYDPEEHNKPKKDDDGYIASLLVDKVTRKVVKQTVMTSVYGVTYVGK